MCLDVKVATVLDWAINNVRIDIVYFFSKLCKVLFYVI